MARPLKGEEGKHVPICVRVSTGMADQLCRLALSRDESVYAVAGFLLARALSQEISRSDERLCYGHSQRSTLSGMLSESPSSSGVSGGRPVKSVHGLRV